MAVNAGRGGLGVGGPGQQPEVPVPAAFGPRPVRQALLEPEPFGTLDHGNACWPCAQKLDLPRSHVTLRIDSHLDRASHGTGHVGRLGRPGLGLGHGHVLGIMEQRPQAHDRGPVDHRDPLPCRPGSTPAHPVVERGLEPGEGEPPERRLDLLQVIPQKLGVAVGLDLELQPLGIAPLHPDAERHVLAPEHLGVARLDAVNHPGGRRNIGERREDSCQGRGDAIGEEAEGQAEGQDAGSGEEQGPAQAAAVDHLAGPEPADPLQGLLHQPPVELGREAGRLACVLDVNATYQPVMDARQMGLDPPRHLNGPEAPKKGTDHAREEGPGRRHDHQDQRQEPEQGDQGHSQVQERDQGERPQAESERQPHSGRDPA